MTVMTFELESSQPWYSCQVIEVAVCFPEAQTLKHNLNYQVLFVVCTQIVRSMDDSPFFSIKTLSKR